MSTNISKQKRDKLIEKIKALRTYISSAEQDENTAALLTYLSEIEKDVCGKKYGLIFVTAKLKLQDSLEPVQKQKY